jgi:hypothetical protein
MSGWKTGDPRDALKADTRIAIATHTREVVGAFVEVEADARCVRLDWTVHGVAFVGADAAWDQRWRWIALPEPETTPGEAMKARVEEATRILLEMHKAGDIHQAGLAQTIAFVCLAYEAPYDQKAEVVLENLRAWERARREGHLYKIAKIILLLDRFVEEEMPALRAKFRKQLEEKETK